MAFSFGKFVLFNVLDYFWSTQKLRYFQYLVNIIISLNKGYFSKNLNKNNVTMEARIMPAAQQSTL